MKTIIVCVTLACGVLGGAYSVTTAEEVKEVQSVPVEYINFEEPLRIRAYANSELGDAY